MWAKLFTPLSIPGKKYNTTPRSVVLYLFIFVSTMRYVSIVLAHWTAAITSQQSSSHKLLVRLYIEELLVQFKLFFFFSSLSTPSNLFKEELGYISLYEYIL